MSKSRIEISNFKSLINSVLAILLLVCFLTSAKALAQSASSAPDTIVVFDGSGSMWGQIDGRAKIEIARETLSSVLSELPGESRIGMIAYGHRQKGVCSDIETVVPVDQANRSVRQMIDVASRLQPKGKTPLSDAVRKAAEELRYTENAATVILVTDGIETCNADPCALGRELEKAGIGFTAHVVGFGLSAKEGKQVQCLADNTGGLYLSADNADELGSALRRAVVAEVAPNEDDFGDAKPAKRNVRFLLRDSPETDLIGIRQLTGHLERADGSRVDEKEFALAYPEANGNSATANLKPGRYTAVLRRATSKTKGYDVRHEFEIPEGQGEHVVEASLAATLKMNVFVNPDLQLIKGQPFPTAVGGSRPRVNFHIFLIVDGEPQGDPLEIKGMPRGPIPLTPGRYLIRGNIDSGTSVERVVEIKSSDNSYDFSFDVTRVYVDARHADNTPVKRQSTFWYDGKPSGRTYWLKGAGISKGELLPFYLPTGTWGLNVGGQGYGKRRSQLLVEVTGDYRDMRLVVGEGKQLDDDQAGFVDSPARKGCLEILRVSYKGCIVERADLGGKGKKEDATQQQESANTPTPKQNEKKADIPADLRGFGGTAYAFETLRTRRKAWLVVDPALGDNAMFVLENDWCASGNCAGRRISLPLDRLASLLSDEVGSGFVSHRDFQIEHRTRGADQKEIDLIPNGQNEVRFFQVGTIELSTQKAKASPIVKEDKAEKATSNPTSLDGLTGKAFVFVDENKEPKAHIVFAPGDTQNATVVLAASWCGLPPCKADRFTVSYKKVDHLLEDGFQSGNAGGSGYTIAVSTFGENQKEIAVSGAGASRVRLTLLDTVQLNGDDASATEKNEQKSKKVKFSEEINRPFGVFQFDSTNDPVERVVSDFLHTNKCYREQVVIWPDGHIETKKFQAPKAGEKNPFKTDASGQCKLDNEGWYRCGLTLSGGSVHTLIFKSKGLGNNHYSLKSKDNSGISLAASCFFPGGEMDPSRKMPNGRTLAEMMLERNDGKAPGMGYDSNKNIFRGE